MYSSLFTLTLLAASLLTYMIMRIFGSYESEKASAKIMWICILASVVLTSLVNVQTPELSVSRYKLHGIEGERVDIYEVNLKDLEDDLSYVCLDNNDTIAVFKLSNPPIVVDTINKGDDIYLTHIVEHRSFLLLYEEKSIWEFSH